MSSKSETAPSETEPDGPSSTMLVAFLEGSTVAFVLPSEGTLTIGRSSACDLPLDHPSISREHSRIVCGERPTIEDLGSRNGTRVRGVPLAPNRPAALHPGDVVECGNATLLLRRASTARLPTSSAPPPSPAFLVGAEGRSLRAPGAELVNLGRRGALRRILLALAKLRVESPGDALGVEALLAAGWPGEKMSYDAGVARVYTTVQRLRALGLATVLVTRDDGYLFDPAVELRIEAPASG